MYFKSPRSGVVVGYDRNAVFEELIKILQKREPQISTNLKIAYKKSGAPFLIGPNKKRLPYFISVTHCGELIAMALSECPVGIDLEKIRLPAHWKKIGERVFSIEDRSRIQKSSSKDSAFIKAWTKKEATVKAFAKGILWKPKKQHTKQLSLRQRRLSFQRQNYWLSLAQITRKQ